jgi:16S rRNA (cytidine1402-2'-O)-methyltransferase
MSGTLFVVATPIGNLEDITLRALRVLREVTLVAAEDTRRTGNLLRHYDIPTPVISYHEHNERQRTVQILDRLRAGASVALVSDAGTPGISDPGAVLVKAAREGGFRVDPVPGPSAVTAALSASGLAFSRFAFAGFPPIRSKDRTKWFSWVESLSDVPVVFYEAPHRIRRTLDEVRRYLVERPILVARELTKVHEQWSSGNSEECKGLDRGEFVVILGQMTTNGSADSQLQATAAPTDVEIQQIFGELTKSAMLPSRRAAIKAVADRLGLSARAVYEALERVKN